MVDHVNGLPCSGVSCDFTTILAFPVKSFPIALNRQKAFAVIFGRYWVTRDLIRMEVIWGEPSWGEQPFPMYPPGLIFIATTNHFSFVRAYYGVQMEFPSPYGVRPAAKDLAGTWNVTKTRFAWSEFLQEHFQVESNYQACIASILKDKNQNIHTNGIIFADGKGGARAAQVFFCKML